MKTIRMIILAVGMVSSLHLLHAQTATVGNFNSGIMRVQSASADSIVGVVAEEQGLQLLPPDQVPHYGTFWTALSGSGGGDGGSNNYSGFSSTYTIDTNLLFLEITNVANGLAYLNLHNGTNFVYCTWSATNLATPFADWQVETELWPSNAAVLPFTVLTQDRQNLFMRAQDWTGVDSNGDGIPDWWIWKFFADLSLNATNLDSQGRTLLYDYTNDLDPNVIAFTVSTTNYYANQTIVPVQINLLAGVPSYYAVLVNDTNYANANWQAYTGTNIVVALGSTDGVYQVLVGLKGLPPSAQETWYPNEIRIILNRVVPVMTITNPIASTVFMPMIQLQGYVSEPLSKLTFDVSNALGVVTGQQGYWSPVFYDTNLLSFTTNSFQCYDIHLTDGLNIITLHASDLAGNLATTNVGFTVNYAGDTIPPGLNIVWPQDGTYISGNNFTLQAQMDDATANVTASIVDANGNTNTVQGLVERSGLVWVQNLPLAAGINSLTVTATDVAGNQTVANLTLIRSSVTVTMDSLSSGQFNQRFVTITGTISDPSSTMTVNGVQATVNDDGTWEADNVPVSPTGTATFAVEVYSGNAPSIARAGFNFSPMDDSGPNLNGSQNFSQPQPVTVVMSSYSQVLNFFNGGYWNENIAINWNHNSGGTYHDWGWVIGSDPGEGTYNYDQEGGLSTNVVLGAPWENAFYNASAPLEVNSSVQSKVMIAPQGQAVPGAISVYLVYANAMNYTSENICDAVITLDFFYYIQPGDTPLPPEWLEINGQTLINSGITNGDGSVSGETIISAPAGVNVDVTPIATQVYGFNDYTFNVQAFDISPRLVADNNRDGNITFDAADQTSTSKPFRFWINDSQESGDVTSGSDTVPGSSSPNYSLNQINGRCDLINFFPVALCLSNVIQWLPPTNGWEYHLSQADSAVKFVYTGLMPTNAFDYLTNWDGYDDYGVNNNEWATNADTIQVTNSQASGTILDTNWLEMVQNNGGYGVILMEGCATTTQPLMLEIWHNGQKMGGVPLYISISGVEQMYRWINLRDSFTVSGETQPTTNYPTRSGQPSNFPDSASNGRQIIYVHGFNVPEQKSRAEIAEAFKRLWQSHSKAMFTGVSWYGDQAYSGLLGISLDYYSNVRNAFLTAPALASTVANLPGTHKVVIAHSLGNMVVSSAIVDCGMNVEKYCAIDAAVAMEAYDGSIKDLGMVNPNVGAGVTFQGWPNYDQRLWSTEWYQLFSSSDGRSGLTWRDRFDAIPNLYNFYSSGEEVLENPPGYQQLPSLGKRWIWVTQEMRKGTGLFDLLGTLWLVDSHPEAGWALNTDWYILPSGAPPGGNTEARYPWQATTNDISDDALRADPFCRAFNDSNLNGTGGSAEATNIQVRAEMLGVGLPALSHAAGANSVSVFGDGHNFDLNSIDPNSGFQTGWPNERMAGQFGMRWLHSDLKDIAYPFNHKLHDTLVQLGGLNQ